MLFKINEEIEFKWKQQRIYAILSRLQISKNTYEIK